MSVYCGRCKHSPKYPECDPKCQDNARAMARKDEYKVWSRKPRRFDTLEAACEYASAYYNRTGVVVAITSK